MQVLAYQSKYSHTPTWQALEVNPYKKNAKFVMKLSKKMSVQKEDAKK